MTSRIWTGTAQVYNGYTTVEVTSGAALSDANCPADGSCVLDGRGHFIASRTSTTVFELTSPWEGDDGVVTLEIDPMNANAISVVSLSTRVTQYDARVALIDANGRGMFYKSLGNTASNDPGPGYLGRNNSDWALTDELYFDVIDQNTQDISDQLNLLVNGDILIVRSIDTNAVARFRVLSTTALSGWYSASVAYLGGTDIIADDEDVAVEWRRVGVGVDYDTHIDTPATLYLYENQAPGYAVLVDDVGDGRSGVYTLIEAGSPSTWGGPAYITGAAGATVSEVLTELGINSITVSTSSPSGGEDGDLWFQVD